MNAMNLWGYHLVVNCSGCSNVTDGEHIKSFVENVIREIKMIPHGNVHMYYMDDQGDNNGWSFVQMIKTSNISGHFVDSNGSAFIDIFSCKEFNQEDALNIINEYFKPKKINHDFFTRSAPTY
jgi:S-adenosylmethionine/arginine decarboxylase-like enzyme